MEKYKVYISEPADNDLRVLSGIYFYSQTCI